MSSKFSSNIKDSWLVVLLSIVIGAVGLYWQYQSRRHEVGGTLNATFHSRLLNNKDARTIIVCLEDSTIDLQDLYVTPTFDNPSEFSLKDFLLSYDVECTNIEIEPTSFVESHKYSKKEWIYKYKDNILAAHDDTKKPFSTFHLKDDIGRCYIKTKASYDGALSAFEYNTDVWFLFQKNTKNLSFDNWKIDCKKRIFEIIDEQFYDVYYFATNHQPEYQFDVALTSSSENTKPTKDASSELESSLNRTQNTSQTSEKNENDNNEEPKHVTPKLIEAPHNQTGIMSTPENVKIDSFVAQNMGEYTSYEIILKEELEAGKEYILKYEGTYDQGNQSYERYTYVDPYMRRNSKKLTLNISGENIDNFIDLIPNSNIEEYLEISKEGDKTKLINKTNSDILCLFRYSSHSSSYRELSGNESMVIENMGAEPILVFDLKTITNKNSLNVDSEDRVKDYLSLFIFALFILTLSFGSIFLGIGVMMFIITGFSDGWKEAKNEVIDYISYKELMNTLHSDKESLRTKIWLCFLTISITLTPVLWAILYLFYL